MHERAAAPAGRPRAVRRALERGAGDRRRAAGDRRELAVLLRHASCGARRASRCSSRPPTRARRSSRRRACARGCGSASAGSPRSSTSSRRTSATSRRCCRSVEDEDPVEVLERGDAPQLRRAAAAQRHDLPLEPARSTTSSRGRPHLRVENRVLPAGPDGRRHRSPTPPSTTAWCAVLAEDERPVWSQMSFSRRRGELPRRRPRRHRRARLLAGRRRGARDRARAAPAAADGARGPRALGRRRRRPRPAAGHHRAPLPRPAATARPGRRRRSTGSTRASSTAPTRCAR